MAVIAGAIAAACGLYGLARRDMPGAAWLRLSAGLAAAVALVGYTGPLAGPFHGGVDHLLDGALAPFRNVYKLEPVIAAALALGVAHAAATWLAAARAGTPSRLRRIYALEARAVAGLVLAGLLLPYLSGQVLNPGSFSAVPRYWYQVAAFLQAHSPRNTAIVVPADAHGDYLWGDPIDDPLVALATSPWAERGLVPYGGAGSQILLTTVEAAIESASRSAACPATCSGPASATWWCATTWTRGRWATRPLRWCTRPWPGPGSPGSPRSARSSAASRSNRRPPANSSRCCPPTRRSRSTPRPARRPRARPVLARGDDPPRPPR